MKYPHESRPPKETARGADRRTTQRTRFVDAHPWTTTEIETAIVTADATQLVRALDHAVGMTSAACTCPVCGSLRSAHALGRHHWRCDACQTLGSWLALRHQVALSVEACVRLAAIVTDDARRGVAA